MYAVTQDAYIICILYACKQAVQYIKYYIELLCITQSQLLHIQTIAVSVPIWGFILSLLNAGWSNQFSPFFHSKLSS